MCELTENNFKRCTEETTTYTYKRQNSPCELRHEMYEGVEVSLQRQR